MRNWPRQDSAGWESLPPALRAAIESRTGKVNDTSPAGEGLSTSVRLILHTDNGDMFVKGTGPDSADHQRRRLALGADLAPYVTTVSPPLLWRVSHPDGWDITGWPALPGIPKMTSLLAKLSEIPAPGVLTDTARDHWADYASDPRIFDGDAIVHRDPNPTNFVIDGNRAWLVDFGWAVRGPAWMTSANLIVSMLEAGWEAADADNTLKSVPAWASAPRHAVDEFARATVREWEQVMERGPVHEVWQFRASVARSWAGYREHTARS
jgi:hypothetical protein